MEGHWDGLALGWLPLGGGIGTFQRSKEMSSRGFAERPRVVRRCGQNQHAVASNEGHKGDAHSGQLPKSI